jgi:hypothetical protein
VVRLGTTRPRTRQFVNVDIIGFLAPLAPGDNACLLVGSRHLERDVSVKDLVASVFRGCSLLGLCETFSVMRLSVPTSFAGQRFLQLGYGTPVHIQVWRIEMTWRHRVLISMSSNSLLSITDNMPVTAPVISREGHIQMVPYSVQWLV